VPAETREAFIDAAVRPLGSNDEVQLLARSRLEERLAADAKEFPRLVARRPKWKWWVLAVALISVLLLGRPALDLYRVITAYDGSGVLGMPQFDQELIRERLARGRGREEALLLVGDWKHGSEEARWRALWRARRDDKGAVGKYFLARVSEELPVPEELAEDILRVDPDNGWYPFMRAAVSSIGIAEPDRPTRAEREAGKAASWTIHDAAELERVIRLATEAADHPRFSSPLHGLARMQARELGEVRDYRSLMLRVAFVFQGGPSEILASRYLAGAFGAAAWSCGENGDDEQLLRLIRAHRQLGRWRCTDAETLLEVLVAQASLRDPLDDFVSAGVELGISEREELVWARELHDALESRREALRGTGDPARDKRIELRGASTMDAVSPGMFEVLVDPPPVDEAALEPGRRAEHAVFGRAFAMAAWLALALAGGAMAARMALSDRVDRELAGSLAGAFRSRDRLLVLGVGVAGPILWFLAVRYLTPLGGLPWGIVHTLWPMNGLQWSALVVLLLWWPGVVAGWRCRKRLACLELRTKPGMSSMVGLAVVAAVIPLAGLASPELEIEALITIAGIGVLGVVVLLLAGAWVWSLTDRQGGLERALKWRLTGPCLLAAVTACLALSALFRAEELYWFSRDRMNLPAEDGRMMAEAGVQITDRLKAELGRILDEAG